MHKYLKNIALGLATAGTFSFFAFDQADNYFEISKNLEIFASLYKEVNTYYVDEIEPGTLMHKAIDEMLKSLDPYTNYISESEIEDYRFMTTGQYGGIGAQIATRKDYIMVREPYDGYAAQKAGLRAGDMILEIDGKSTKDKTTDDVSKLLKGSPGTDVKLLVRRGDETAKPELFTVRREEIKVKNVPYSGMINSEIGYIKFAGFRQEASDEVRNALMELKKEPSIKGLVLDLRGNPGGLLDEAIKSVNIFVDKGQLVVSTKGKMVDWNKEYFTESSATDTRLPVVVLTDKGSASASEIVSGSLQDLDRAVVVGENSYGKGLVQTTRPLPYNSQLKVTTSKYYIPSGRCIQAIDYSHHDESGRAIKTPDSLKKAFKTKSGRVVYAGQGIKPDVSTERKKYADIVLSLSSKNLFFDYATNYRNKHASIPSAYEFKLSEQDWQEFMAFLKGKDYEYSTDTEEILAKVEKTAKEEKYFEAIKTDYEDMRAKLKADKKADLEKYKSDIKEILQDEIAARYYYQKGRIQASFDDDADIQEAVKLLRNPTEYNHILTAGK